MSTKNTVRFTISIPKKRIRNSLVIGQARGEALTPQRMTEKRYKPARNPRSWENEDWGDD
jgi:hypothetical protein